VSAGLLDEGQVSRLAGHAAGFPAMSVHKLFFEFELQRDTGALALAGYGHGFRPPALAALLDEQAPFVSSELGRQIIAALRTDPFDPSGQRSRRSQDGEPEWIEYDVDDGTIAALPGLFFALPAKLRRLHTMAQIEELLEELAARTPALRETDETASAQTLAGFLRELGRAEFDHGNPLRAYRVGLSENRAPGWLRLLVGGLRSESLDSLAERAVEGPYLAQVSRRNAALFSGDERSKLTASIDLVHGQLRAIDLEGPYLFHLRDWTRRAELGAEFCARLAADGIIAPTLADRLAPLIVVEPPRSPVSGRRALLLVNHFKFGVAGRHHGRVKLYFELLIWRAEGPGPRGWS